ncbi:MAG: C25 family cysteine peptidase [Planctomycetota bacterium]
MNAGINIATWPADRIALYNGASELPIVVSDDGDNSLEENEAITFIGSAYKDAYTARNVYRLGVKSTAGLRMAEVALAPAGGTDRTADGFVRTFAWEEENIYQSMFPADPEADHWYAGVLYSGAASMDIPLDLGNVFTGAGQTATLTVHLMGLGDDTALDPDHTITVKVNGTTVGTTTFDGAIAHTAAFDFTQDLLVTGTNTVTIATSGAPMDVVLVDRITLAARTNFTAQADTLRPALGSAGLYSLAGFTEDTVQVFDVTGTPAVVTGAQVVGGTVTLESAVPRTLLAAAESALPAPAAIVRIPGQNLATLAPCDYLVISGFSDMDFVSDLAAIHPDLTVTGVDVRDIYNQFGDGRVAPQAIRDFIAHCVTTWPVPPRFVLLAGDCAYDRTGLVPTKYILDEFYGVVPADNWVACVSGADAIPDIALGRIPADSPAELAMAITKAGQYRNLAPTGDWETNLIFTADDDDGIAGDEAFPGLNAELAGLAGGDYNRMMINLRDFADPADCTADLVSKIDQGALMVEYMGHGGVWVWASEPLFTDVEAKALATVNFRYPFFVTMACLDGYFIEPDPAFRSLSEHLLFNPNGGAVACFASAGFANAEDKFPLGRGIYTAVFEDDIRTLGEAVRRAKENYAAVNAGYAELVLQTHNLIGDPALELRVPAPRKVTGLRGTADDKGVTVTWNAGDADVTGYTVYRSLDNGTFVLAGQTAVGVMALADAAVPHDTRVYYLVVAANSRGLESVPSDTVAVRTNKDINADDGLFGCTAGHGRTAAATVLAIMGMLVGLTAMRRRL